MDWAHLQVEGWYELNSDRVDQHWLWVGLPDHYKKKGVGYGLTFNLETTEVNLTCLPLLAMMDEWSAIPEYLPDCDILTL